MTLDKLEINQSAVIAAVLGQGSFRKRLLDLGLTPKTRVTLYKKAPFGDPLELILRGYHLTIRLMDAKNIVVVGE